MSIRLILPGKSAMPAGIAPVDPETASFLTVRTVQENVIEGPSRGGIEPTVERECEDSDVIELTFSDGTRQWISAAALRDDLEQTDFRTSTERGARVPSLFAPATAERGIASSLVLKALKVLKLDPVDAVADAATRSVIAHFETQVLPRQGLFRYQTPEAMGNDAGQLSAAAPILVFLHGTMSSTTGSFGKLAGTAEWTRLRDRYGDRILGFEHPTLSKSPIQNAIELAQALPKNATLHLVSHSRGGLIGELLSLDPSQDVSVLQAAFAGRPMDADALGSLMQTLAERQFKIERFVRVACPARGTTLASKRLDILLSGFLNLIELIPVAKESFAFGFVKAVTLEIARRRTDSKELPGIEAMMPTSPLVRMLNTVAQSKGDLAVIAGDAEGAGVLGRLKNLAIDAFFLAKNDYVVNTESMYGGISRGGQPPFKVFDSGPTVNHFQYFANNATRVSMVNWLESGPAAPVATGFARGFLPQFIKGIADSLRPDAPAVFLLPGIMGSQIQIGNDNIWINPARLAAGGLGRMANLSQGGPNGILNSFYGLLSTALVKDFAVREFDYDWRNSLEKAAARLAQQVSKELEDRPRGVVYFLAHSMGGLVVRMMIANHNEVWKQVTKRGGRLLMLGTPNAGSYAVPVTLAGQNPLIGVLGAVDFKSSEEQLRDIIKGFPGLLELLPESLFDPDAWRGKPGVAAPDAGLLKAAQAVRAKIANAIDPAAMVYVAGAGATANGWKKDENGELQFEFDPLGDGTVTHASGLLPGVLTRYVNASHGNLANHVNSFAGYIELLRTGTTSRLSDVPIRARGLEAAAPPRASVLFPTADEIAAAALQGTPPVAAPEMQPSLRISVVHGDLLYAQLPVVVGHYEDDGIVSAEKTLDRALRGELSRRLQMGLYPGAPGTAEVIPGPAGNSLGAMVIGLGRVGEITAGRVKDGITAAALRLALLRTPHAADSQPVQIAFASLLIGTFGGRNSLTVEQSVRSIILGAAQANRTLKEQGLDKRVQIDRIDLIEIYEDVALQAASALDRLVDRLPLEEPDLRLEMAPRYLRHLEGGSFHRPADEYSSGWWRRVQVTRQNTPTLKPIQGDQVIGLLRRARQGGSPVEVEQFLTSLLKDEPGTSVSGGSQLRFIALTDRARAEAIDHAVQASLIDGLVREAIGSADTNSQLGQTLFDLLLPNEFKEQTASETDLLLVLDEGTAQYPWELLSSLQGGKLHPLALEKGLIRQFVTERFRLRPRSTPQNAVLVIGDPKNDLFQLSGARAEAQQVAAAFRQHQDPAFAVTSLDNPGALETINSLFAAEYRILHIAGHGFYDPDNPINSGVLLNNGCKITPAEIEALRTAPELVFLNCCHLGTLDDEKTRRKDNFHELAASVSQQLIKIGARAVVAAGWAVNDAAAATFATTFYQEMLDKKTFGKAVLEARRQTHQRHPNSNTWGAYQCYGDPDFMLFLQQDWIAPKERPVYSQRQRLNRLRTLVSRASRLETQSEKEETAANLDQILADMPEHWKDGEMLAALAGVWSALGNSERAIGLYQRALNAERATAPYSAEEQLANQQGRQGEALTKANGEEARKLFEEAERRLDRLLACGKTSERFSLKGSLAKRRAIVAQDERSRMAHLKQSGEAYKQAFDLARAAGESGMYPGLNCAALRYLTAGAVEDLPEFVLQLRASIATQAASEQTVWDRAATPDSLLMLHLAQGSLDAGGNDVIQAYQALFELGVSGRERESVLTQIRFLFSMLQHLGRSDEAAAIGVILEGLGTPPDEVSVAVRRPAKKVVTKGAKKRTAAKRGKKT